MGYTIGFAGKGGTGKTTIASVVVRYLVKRDLTPVLAIDADPNASLGEMLGVAAEDTVVGIIDDISANLAKLPAGITKERLIETRIQQSLGEGGGLDLLVMGRPEGPGCYCYPNSLMRESIGRLQKSYRYIVIDNEAGMEHISRRTDRRIDYLFIVSDHTIHGIRTAGKILDLANELKISKGKTHLIINRSNKGLPSLESEIKHLTVDRVDYLNESSELVRASAMGKTIIDLGEDNELVKAVYDIMEKVIEEISGDRIVKGKVEQQR